MSITNVFPVRQTKLVKRKVIIVPLMLQQFEQASTDVEKVLESYEKLGKVPSTVMEAR